MSSTRVAIVGGGVSGLSVAYFLGQLGIQSVLIEKAPRLGGLIMTDYVEGCRLEAGPDSYLALKPALEDLAGELGEIGQQVISSNDSAKRVFIVRSGKLVPLPRGMSMMVPGEWPSALKSDLFSFATKLRFLRETQTKPRLRPADVSVAEFVSDHFGREMLEYVADPLLAGVYGGSAKNLSAGSVLPGFVDYEERFGSLIKGVRSQAKPGPRKSIFRSFRDGMQSFTDSLAQSVQAQGGVEVVHDEVLTMGRAKNGWHARTAWQIIEAETVVLACPTYVCGELLASAAPTLAAALAEIQYSSAILVTLVYDATKVQPLNGFGFLVPEKERRVIAAATSVNTKFPSRIASGLVAFRAFIVGKDADRFTNTSDGELINAVREDFSRLIGIDQAPRFTTLYRWPRSMPQYTIGHKARQVRITEHLANMPDLHLVGNAYDGVGIPDCVKRAKAVAQKITDIKTQ